MSGRDPRVDPRAGDVLRKGRVERRVDDTYSGGLRIQWSRPGGWRRWFCTRETWRRWAAGAEALRVAEEEE